MHEDDYTGVQVEDSDQLSMFAEHGLYEFDPDEADLTLIVSEDEDEAVINIGVIADGAKSLREVAERLYEFADELLELSGEGWEIVDDIVNGYGTAVRFGTDEDDKVGV